MKLTDATEGKEYIVNSINTKDEELNAFCLHRCHQY